MTLKFLILNYQVVPGRFELPTSTLSVWRSNQLSYRTIHAEEGFVEDAQFLSIPIIKQTKRTRSLKGKQTPRH